MRSKGSLLHENYRGDSLEPAVVRFPAGEEEGSYPTYFYFLKEEKEVGRGVGGREERRCEDFSAAS